MRPTSLYAAPFSLPLLEGGNRVQVPRWAVQALLGPPATAEHGLQTQPPQQQALGETLPTTSAAGPGTPQPPQAQGRQDSDSCRGRCRPAPSVRPTSTPAPILRLPCLGEGLGQVGQDPVWWGTVQGRAGRHSVLCGTQQGLAVLLWMLGHRQGAGDSPCSCTWAGLASGSAGTMEPVLLPGPPAL